MNGQVEQTEEERSIGINHEAVILLSQRDSGVRRIERTRRMIASRAIRVKSRTVPAPFVTALIVFEFSSLTPSAM